MLDLMASRWIDLARALMDRFSRDKAKALKPSAAISSDHWKLLQLTVHVGIHCASRRGAFEVVEKQFWRCIPRINEALETASIPMQLETLHLLLEVASGNDLDPRKSIVFAAEEAASSRCIEMAKLLLVDWGILFDTRKALEIAVAKNDRASTPAQQPGHDRARFAGNCSFSECGNGDALVAPDCACSTTFYCEFWWGCITSRR